MQEPRTLQSLAPAAPSVKLWTPGFVAAVSFFLRFPSGIVLASVNWLRMKMNDKAILHLAIGAVGTFILVLVLIFAPDNVGRLPALAVNLGMFFYLQRQMDSDTKKFQSTNTVEKAGWPGGCLIGIGVLLLFVIGTLVLGVVLVLLDVPVPG